MKRIELYARTFNLTSPFAGVRVGWANGPVHHFARAYINAAGQIPKEEVMLLKMSTKGRYALEALTYMGSLEDNAPQNIKTLSEKTNITERYLEQIFFILRKAKILETKRGPAGGYFIAIDIKKLTAGDVVRAVEGEIMPVACLEGKNKCSSNIYDSCATRCLWIRISNAIENVLDNITIAELANHYNDMLVNS